jgi:hypothetical protein
VTVLRKYTSDQHAKGSVDRAALSSVAYKRREGAIRVNYGIAYRLVNLTDAEQKPCVCLEILLLKSSNKNGKLMGDTDLKHELYAGCNSSGPWQLQVLHTLLIPGLDNIS